MPSDGIGPVAWLAQEVLMMWLFLVWFACEADPCDLALQRQSAAVSACGGHLNRAPWHGKTCSAEEADLLSCEADCMERADCVALADRATGWSENYPRVT